MWRRGRDLNSRMGYPISGFQDHQSQTPRIFQMYRKIQKSTTGASCRYIARFAWRFVGCEGSEGRRQLAHYLKQLARRHLRVFVHSIRLCSYASSAACERRIALREMGGELIEVEGIEHTVFRDRSLACHQHAPPDIVDLVC